MFETETVGPCLVQKLKCGAMAPLPPLHPPNPPQWLRPCKFQSFWFSPSANYDRCVWSRPVKFCWHQEFLSFYRFLKLSRFVEFSSRYSLLSLLNQSLIRKSFYPLYKAYSFDVLGGCAGSRYTIQRFTTHQFTIHASTKSFFA